MSQLLELAARQRMLSKLPTAELEHLAAEAEVLTLDRAHPLVTPYEPIRDVWFPVTALASLVIVLEDGATVEAGAVGRDGMVGVALLLGAETTPMQTLIQVPGEVIRVPAARVIDALSNGGVLRDLVQRYTHFLFVMASQSAACNRRHPMEERMARWLLVSSDGIGSDRVAITHEFLATMMGVRRSGVTETAQHLQEKGLIDYRRASVDIIDRAGLEGAACECYRVTRREYERLFG